VARGVCLGLFLGFIPLNGPMALLLFIFFFLFNINRSSTAVTLPLFKLLYVLGASNLADRNRRISSGRRVFSYRLLEFCHGAAYRSAS